MLKLGAAAQALDMEAVQQLVTNLRPTQPEIATSLEVLTQRFRFDRIVNLCDAQATKDRS